MSKYKKFQFKVELILNLISVADIQTWAITCLENNNENQLAIELCFLSTEQQIYDYFNQISIEQMFLTQELKKKLIYETFLKYAKNPPQINFSEALVFDIFKRFLELANYINDEDLFNLISSYSDELYLALEIYKTNPNEVLPAFLMELQSFIESKIQ